MDYLSDLYESLKLTFEIFLVLCVIWSIWINQLELTLVFELPSRVREEETCVSLVIPTTVQGLAESSCLRNQHVWETLAEKAASCLSRCSTSSCVLRSSAEFGKPGVLLSAGPCSLCVGKGFGWSESNSSVAEAWGSFGLPLCFSSGSWSP